MCTIATGLREYETRRNTGQLRFLLPLGNSDHKIANCALCVTWEVDENSDYFLLPLSETWLFV